MAASYIIGLQFYRLTTLNAFYKIDIANVLIRRFRKIAKSDY